MKGLIYVRVAAGLLVCGMWYAAPAPAQSAQQTLDAQITKCRQMLNFQSLPSAGSCMGPNTYSYVRMETPSPAGTTSRIGYVKLSDDVDALFHCESVDEVNKTFAGSQEMTIHSRSSGNTCHFERATGTGQHSVNFPALSDASYWVRAGAFRECAACHDSGGPYLAMGSADAMASFGLLNNGHDTMQARYHIVNANTAAEANENASVSQGLVFNDCANGCHAIRPDGFKLTRNSEMMSAGLMQPYFDDSPHRWINRDTAANGSDVEAFADARIDYATLLKNCDAPGNLEAHAVGVPNGFSFSTEQMKLLPDRLRSFNLKDGLVCLNVDQEPGQTCHDYQSRYLCNGTWTGWLDHSVAGDGDHEERSRFTGLCAAPTAIQAHVFNGAGSADIYGPNDRLARLSRFGLGCNNADQPNGQCSNYVVRFRACTGPELRYQGHINSAWQPNLNLQLTASGPGDNAAARGQPHSASPEWNTQWWELIPVPDTEYVWLRNIGTDTYLNASTQAENSPVVTYSLHGDWDSEKWVIEKLNGGGNSVRLRNLWSGRYLTMADTGGFSVMKSQALNTTWASQRWVIN
jgi:Mucin-2 protein WxxW repeating region